MNEELQFILDSTKESMSAAITHLENELLNIRAGKANPVMLKSVMVDYYGTQTPLIKLPMSILQTEEHLLYSHGKKPC